MMDREIGNLEKLISSLDKDDPNFNTNLFLVFQEVFTRLNGKLDDFYSSEETPISRHFLPVFDRYDDRSSVVRQVYRVEVDCGAPPASGQSKTVPTGIEMRDRMALIHMSAALTQVTDNPDGWVKAKRAGTDNVRIERDNIIITGDGSMSGYNQIFVTIEYIRVLQLIDA